MKINNQHVFLFFALSLILLIKFHVTICGPFENRQHTLVFSEIVCCAVFIVRSIERNNTKELHSPDVLSSTLIYNMLYTNLMGRALIVR
jgi:hypothetical protein